MERAKKFVRTSCKSRIMMQIVIKIYKKGRPYIWANFLTEYTIPAKIPMWKKEAG